MGVVLFSYIYLSRILFVRVIVIVQVPISGAYADILYDFEATFGVPSGGSFNTDAVLSIANILGHGVKVNTWSRDNGVKAVTGLNNVEPSALVDGKFSGSFSIEFDITPDISWLKAVMGAETVSGLDKSYSKNVTPPSMTFAVFLKNDSTSPSYGEAFLINGVIITNAQFSQDNGDSPFHAQLDCTYQNETLLDNFVDIPALGTPRDQPFNFGMVNAYFWNPGADQNLPASFSSIECTIDKLNFSIKHNGSLVNGIGNRIAKDKVHNNMEYDLSMSAVFKDPRKFLQNFYGSSTSPANFINPYSQVTVVLENFYRDSRHAKISFTFQTLKLKTYSTPLQIENVIMEDLAFVPLTLTIDTNRGPAVPTFSLSPQFVVQGRELYIKGTNFYPGEVVTLSSTLFSSNVLLTANALGEADYVYVVPTTASAVYCPISVTAPESMTTAQSFDLTVISTTALLPAINSSVIVFPSGTATPFTLMGYNMGSSLVTIGIDQWSYVSNTWVASTGISGTITPTNGMFAYSGSATITNPGKYRIKALGAVNAYYEIFVPQVLTSTISMTNQAHDTYTFAAEYLPPGVDCIITYVDTPGNVPIGIYGAASTGYLPGPTSSYTITYLRSVSFTVISPSVSVTIPDVNGSQFVFTGTVTVNS